MTLLPMDGKFYELPAKEKQRQWQETMDMCVTEGRTARSCRVRLDACPPFVDEDMAVSWRMGWHQRDAELKRRPAPN